LLVDADEVEPGTVGFEELEEVDALVDELETSALELVVEIFELELVVPALKVAGLVEELDTGMLELEVGAFELELLDTGVEELALELDTDVEVVGFTEEVLN
jgi:hypothetical protein